MKAVGVIDEHGRQVRGEMIRQLQGMDGLLIYFVLFNHQLDYVELRQLVEYLVDHDIIQRQLDRKDEDKKREWMRTRLRELRENNPQVSWEDVEAEWEKEHPRVLTKIEVIHSEFSALVPHPELHGGKRARTCGRRSRTARSASSSSSRSTASSTRRATCSRTSCGS